MFFILTAFLVAGGLIMNFFGISIPGLRIAGGMIVSYLGFRMLFPETRRDLAARSRPRRVPRRTSRSRRSRCRA